MNSLIIEADFDSSFIDNKLAIDNWSSEKSTRSCLYFMKLYPSPKTFVNLVQIYYLVNERNYDVNYLSANVLLYNSHRNLCQIFNFFFILYCRSKMSGMYFYFQFLWITHLVHFKLTCIIEIRLFQKEKITRFSIWCP